MRRFAWVWLVVVFSISLGASQAQDIANWTILHYTAVDNDLEGAAFNDYYEMQTAGSGEGVNIIAQLDRAVGYDARFGDWTDTRRFLIEQVPALPVPDIMGKRAAVLDFLVAQGADAAEIQAALEQTDDAIVEQIYATNNLAATFEQTPIMELGEVDMGDPAALTDFVVWGAQNFPAQHYLIVIGSHGSGWRGLGPDEGNDHSMLTLPEIDAALADARAELGIERFDIVGFDACLMGVADVAVTLQDDADYVIFAQEVIPSNGWEYTTSIGAIKANPDWDAFQVGAAFVDSYMDYYAGEGARTKVDLALVETAGLPGLTAALENFGQVVGADTVELLSALGSARNNSQVFGASLSDRAEYYSYIDLRDFMNWFSLQTTITDDAYNAAQEVLAAYDSAVVYARADDKLPGANGLGIYLPATPPIYEVYGADYPAQAPAGMAFWQGYLNQFYSTIMTELDGSALLLEISQVFTLGEMGSTLDTPVVFFDAGGKGVIDLNYTILYQQDDGSQVIVDASPISYNTTLPTGETVIEYPNELTPSTFQWSVTFPYLSDGTNSALALPQSSSAAGSDLTIAGTYVSARGSQPAYLIFESGTFAYRGMLAIADQAPFEARPQPGDQFIVDLYRITPDGAVEVQPLTDTPLTFGLEPFTLSYQPAVSGAYNVRLAMTDLAGNQAAQLAALVIDNGAVDGSLRGYTDTNEGVYFQYPFAWGEPYSYTNEDGTPTQVVSDLAGENLMTATAIYETDALVALETFTTMLAGEYGEIVEATLGGLPAYRIEYSLPTETGRLTGVAYSVLHPGSGAALVFTVETSGDGSAAPNLDALLDGTLYLFPPM